jgi:bifunctional DNA-binding transcriptional regulator/antitoxin component of YhaV-PrlF toxin-antitoxin module
MAYIYPDIVDTINKSKFEVRISDQYEFVVPKYYRDNPHLKPVYDEAEQHCTSFISIDQIIRMTVEGQTVIIVKREDVVTIVAIIEKYSEMLTSSLAASTARGQIAHDDPRKIYLSRCTRTLSVLKDEGERAERDIESTLKLKKSTSVADVIKNIASLLGR